MKNLEQIRAAAAVDFWNHQQNGDTRGAEGGDVIRGLASLIINNGLLATLAFAEEKKRGYLAFCNAIGDFLTNPEISIISKPEIPNLKGYISVLTQADSLTLQRATAEALAYISYLKRLRAHL